MELNNISNNEVNMGNWKTISLGEILTEKEIKDCINFLDKNELPKLGEYLNNRKQELELKGVVADYLYYLLQNLRNEGKI